MKDHRSGTAAFTLDGSRRSPATGRGLAAADARTYSQRLRAASFCLLVVGVLCAFLLLPGNKAVAQQATITINAGEVTGHINPMLFGHFIEHEHNTIEGGLWAELLRDRKFEEGEVKGDGVANLWQPEERIQDRYWMLSNGRTQGHRYFVDHREYYGGGSSQAIELSGPNEHASIYQIGLQLVRGRRYNFYVYMKARGASTESPAGGSGFVELDALKHPVFSRTEFPHVAAEWTKYSGSFIAPEDTRAARMRIGVTGSGTFWIDSASLMPADNWHGIRRDVIEAMRPLRIPVMRYPGGCFADYYHWKLGIGPRDQRPEFWGTAWNEWNQNDFGFDDYILLAHELGFEGHITTNYVSGTGQEASDWVEYANGGQQTPMGRLRARNGHSEPYHVKYWAVGNEAPSLCSEEYTGGTTLNQYAQRFRDFSARMRRVDASITIMASSVGEPQWVRDLFSVLHPPLIASSIYTGSYETDLNTKLCDLGDYYRRVVAEPVEFERKLQANLSAVGQAAPPQHYFAITEWNSWWLAETVDPDYRLGTALYYAGVFNSLLRHSRQVLMAEVSTTVNVQGIIEVDPVTVKLTPPYMTFLLYRNHSGTDVVESKTEAPMTAFNPQLPVLDAVATVHGNTLYVSVTNREPDRDVMTTLSFQGWTPAGGEARIFELNGSSPNAKNEYGNTGEVNIRERSVPVAAPFIYRFPAHSVTVIELNGASRLGR